MDMKVSGSGHIMAGEYDNIHVSGASKVQGPIRCKSFHCSGSSRCEGSLEASEGVHISGSSHFHGNIQANSIHISGSSSIDGRCIAKEEAQMSGGFRCSGDLKANRLRLSGSAHAANIEAEEVSISGKVICPGLLNAEKTTIKLHGATSQIGNIGGSVIHIGQDCKDDYEIHINLFFFQYKSKKSKEPGKLTVAEAIEGDEIILDHVTAKTVVGRVITIGPGCHIDSLQYSESVEIDPDAHVGRKERI